MTDETRTPIGASTARWSGPLRVLALLTTALVLAGCSGSSGGSGSSSASDELVTSVTADAAPRSAQVPIVTVKTSDAAIVTVTATSGDHKVVAPPSKSGRTHEVPMLGLRTDRDYKLSVTAKSEDEVEERPDAAHFTTPALPKGFPPIKVTSDPKRVSPGILLAPVITPGRGVTHTDAVVGIDEEGEVVWYYRTEQQIISVEPTPRGTLLLTIDDGIVRNFDLVAREIDMLGNTVTEWHSKLARASGRNIVEEDGAPPPISVGFDSFHHDFRQLPNGHYINLSTELIEVDANEGREMCPNNPVRHIVSDVVVEFTREGDVVGRWPISAVLDPAKRPGTELCNAEDANDAPDDWMYPGVSDERDWTHANHVAVDEANNTLMVSLRHLNAVVGIRYHDDEDGAAGELLWELGPDGNLQMQGDGQFPYHQHAAKLRKDGTMILFDNGNGRPGTTDAGGAIPTSSRAVIYKIDPDARTVTQVWDHTDENPWGGPTFVSFLGDADELDNGDILITYSLVADENTVPHARIVEVVPDIEGGGAGDQIVFDLLIGDGSGTGAVTYHSVKVPSLYPEPS